MTVEINLPEHWQWVTIKAIQAPEKRATITGPFGSSIGKRFFVSEGVPVIRGNNLNYSIGSFHDDGFVFISREKANELKGYIVKPSDLIFTAAGTIGQVGLIPKKAKFNEYVISNKQMRVRLDLKKVDPLYVYYWFVSPYMNAYIKRQNTGSTIPLINLSVLRALPLPLPALSEQERIGRFLKSLDDKIGINHQINQTFEQMAQALFKSWFVDFDPVKAKIAARKRWQALQPENESASPVCYAAEFDEPPAIGDLESYMNRAAMQAISGKTAVQLDALRVEDPERYHELYEIAALFPSAMQRSELGEIPEGWEVTPFEKLARLDSSSIKPSDNPEKIWEHYSIPAFDAGKAPALDAGISIKSGKYKVKKTSVLISKLNPGTSRVWWPEPLDNESAICSTEFMQFVPKSEELRAFIAGVISSSPFQEGVVASVTGSTGSRQRAQPKQVARMDVVAPCEALALRYARQSRLLFTAQAKNISQSQKLAGLRDTLLPKLLSGELTIPSDEEVQAKQQEAAHV
ncbi:restriction endonuclease subunit S [Vreelandella sp. EE22]